MVQSIEIDLPEAQGTSAVHWGAATMTVRYQHLLQLGKVVPKVAIDIVD